MMSGLSVQQLQFSADPDDWAWVRWERARPGALPMPFLHRFGFGLWDSPNRQTVQGPQIRMAGGAYRPPAVSPFPGLTYSGAERFWADGVTAAEAPQPPNCDPCGAPAWVPDWGVDWAFGFADAVAAGGQEEGGQAEQHGGAQQLAAGGQEEGGQAEQYAGGYQLGAGGQEEGGQAEQHGPPVLLAAGGQEEGGQAEQHGGAQQLAAGGQEEGGQAEQYGGGPAVCTFVSGEVTGMFFDDYSIWIPGGTDPTDTVILAVWIDDNAGSIDTPAGFTEIGITFNTAGPRVVVLRATVADIPADPIPISFAGAVASVATAARVSNVDVVDHGLAQSGNSAAQLINGCTPVADGSVLLAVAGQLVFSGLYNNPDEGFSHVVVDPATMPLAMWYLPDVPAGAFPAVFVWPDDSGDYCSMMFFCSPPT